MTQKALEVCIAAKIVDANYRVCALLDLKQISHDFNDPAA